MKQEKIHSKLGNFVKSAVDSSGRPITDDLFQQIFPETTDADVLIDSENQEIPTYDRLADLIQALSKYAIKREGIELTSKYTGYGKPENISGASTGDRYIDIQTGKIYELRGLSDLQSPEDITAYGFKRLDFSGGDGSYLMSLQDDKVTNSTTRSALNAILDDSPTSGIDLYANRALVFTANENVSVQKIRLSYSGAGNQAGYLYVQGSTNDPVSTSFGDNPRMNWANLLSGVDRSDSVNSRVLYKTVTLDGSGTIDVALLNSAYSDCKYYALTFIPVDSTTSVKVTGLSFYTFSDKEVVPYKWVCIDDGSNDASSLGKHDLSVDKVIPKALKTSMSNPCTSSIEEADPAAIVAYAYAGAVAGTKIFYSEGTRITSTSNTNVFSIYTKVGSTYRRLTNGEVTDYTFDDSYKDITIVFRDTTDRFTKAEHLEKLAQYNIEPVIRVDDMEAMIKYYMSDVSITEDFVTEKIREFITFSPSLPSTAPAGSICYVGDVTE